MTTLIETTAQMIDQSAAHPAVQFLGTLSYEPNDLIAFWMKNPDGPSLQEFVTAREAVAPTFISKLKKLNESHSIYVSMNSFKDDRSRSEANVAKVRHLWADFDKDGIESLTKLNSSNKVQQPAAISETSDGKYQAVWNVEDDISISEAKRLLKGIAAEFGGDPQVTDCARVLRVPGFKNHKYPHKPEARIEFLDEAPKRYKAKDFDVAVSADQSSDIATVAKSSDPIPNGMRNSVLHFIAFNLWRCGLSPDLLEEQIFRINEERCIPQLTQDEIRLTILKSVTKHPQTPDPTVTIGGAVPGIASSSEPVLDPNDWRSQFRKVGELEEGGVKMLVDGLLPEGTIFIGALSGQGKTLFALSLVKALTTGQPMFGQFDVSEKHPVLYLIPESSARAFKGRLKKFHIPDDERLFLCRTLSEGRTLRLDDPTIHEAVRQMKPVVILDTAIRFSTADDENSSVQNQKLVDDMISLRQLGASAVVAMHHATKSSRVESMDLENSLRGTGDLGACADAVYGIRRDESLYDSGNGPLEF